MDDNYFYKAIVNLFSAFLAFITAMAICGIISVLTSCRSVKYVSVPEYHTEYKTRVDSVLKRDSVWIHDSVSVWMKNDTVFKDRWHTEWRYHKNDNIRQDTILKTDSVRVPYPVEKKLSKWQQIKVDYFVPLVCLCVIFLLPLLWLIKRRL